MRRLIRVGGVRGVRGVRRLGRLGGVSKDSSSLHLAKQPQPAKAGENHTGVCNIYNLHVNILKKISDDLSFVLHINNFLFLLLSFCINFRTKEVAWSFQQAKKKKSNKS